MDGATKLAIQNVLNCFDDGPNHCTGTMSNGELVWKGSFITFMERLRYRIADDSENMSLNVVVATYRMQDASKAREHRDRLKAEGQDAFLTMEPGLMRHSGYYSVHVNMPKQD
ncbi:MAG: hypothetical protein WAM53_04370 [Terrimicrobiaceae bacterium]